jgi:hypothetical protein
LRPAPPAAGFVFADPLAIDLVFDLKIVDQRLLTAVYPARKEGENELEIDILRIAL